VIHRTGGWPPTRGATLLVLLVLAAAIAACGSGTSTPTGAGGSSSPTSSSGPASPAATTADQAAAAAFATALAPFRAAASFTTTITVGDQVVATSSGRSVGTSSQLTIISDSQSVEYIQVPPSAWARPSGGAWTLLTPDQAPGDPLEALAAPASIAAVTPGDLSHLSAVYPAASLGLTGDPVTVTVVIDGDSLTFRYETKVGVSPASSVTVLKPATSTDPIVAPKT
jgi:hypothetical protein